MPEITQSASYRPLQAAPLREPYKFDGALKSEVLDGKKFRSLHNQNSDGQYTAIYSSKFQRVHPTQEEFSAKIGEEYRELVDISSTNGTQTAKLKQNADDKPIRSRIGSATRGTKEASESTEKDFHEAFRTEMDSNEAPSTRGFFSKIWDKMRGNEEKLSLTKGVDNSIGIKTNTSDPAGDSLEVQPLDQEIKDQSIWKKIGYGLLAVAGIGVLGATGALVPMLLGSATLVIGLGAIGGIIGGIGLAKLCSNIKSPWWAKTVDGQRQWAERKAALEVGNGIEEMVKNQVLKGVVGDDAEFNPTDQSQWKDPALLKSDMVVGWMKLAKHNSPDEMKAKIREELLKPNKSFLHPQTIKDAKRGAITGWWFTGNPKGHAEKTVNIVAEEIYRGVIRGMASGYMGLVEAEMADAKTKTAQDALKPWLADNIEGFKSALSQFPAGGDANQPADGALESRAFEFYETGKAIEKVESYQNQAVAVQTQLDAKKDAIGDANHGVYSEVLKSFNHDVATFKDSLGVVDRLVHGKDAPDGNPTLQSVNSGLGEILDTHLNPSEKMESVDAIQQRLNADLAKLDGLIAKEVADDNANPALLKQHHDGLTALSAKYQGDNGAIQAVAKFATTLATAEKALKGNDLTRAKIQEQKDNLSPSGLSNLTESDACPIKTDTKVLEKITRAEGNRDKMVQDIDELDAAYAQFEKMEASSADLVQQAQSNLHDALRSDNFKKLGDQKESVLLGLKNWEKANHAIPIDLDPKTKFASIKKQMVAGALGLPVGSDLNSMGFALEALCEENRTVVVDKLKNLGAERTADLLKTLNTIHDGQGSDTVKAAKTYEAAVQSGIDSNEAATLAKTLYPDQAAPLENFRKFSVVLASIDKVKGDVAEPLAIWARLQGIKDADPSTRSGFLELLGNENLLDLLEDKEAIEVLKTQIARLGDGSLSDYAGTIGGMDSTLLATLEKLFSNLSGTIISQNISEATTRLKAQAEAIKQQIGGAEGLSSAAKVETKNANELKLAGELINQVVDNLKDAGIELKNATLSAGEAAKAIQELVGAKISSDQINEKLLKNKELSQLLQLGIEAEKVVNGRQDIPSLSHQFTPEQLKKGLLDLSRCPVVSLTGNTHLGLTEREYLAQRNKVIQRIQKETNRIDAMDLSKIDKAEAKAISKYRTEIENFLHEERAYKAMQSLYADGTVSTADLRKLFEKHSADYQQTRIDLNRNLGTEELLSDTNLKKLDDNHLQNLQPQIDALKNLQNPNDHKSIWKDSAYLKGVEIRLAETRGEGKTRGAFEEAASGGLVEYGKRLHQGDAGKKVNPEQIPLTYLKGQSEAVKRGLKYLNPKDMEISRPGIFRRAYNKIFSPATKYEKLVGSTDLKLLSKNICKLSQNTALQTYLEGTLEDLKDQQVYLVQKRNALVGDAKKVEMGLRMFAIDQLVDLAASDANAQLTESDFNAAVAKWKERLGDSENVFSDLEADLKNKLVGKSISELEADLDPETQAEFDKQLESMEAHIRDVARAHDQLAAKINAAADLVTYNEMTREDFGNSRLFVKNRSNKEPPTWMRLSNVSRKEDQKITDILIAMRDSASDSSLKSSIESLYEIFNGVETLHKLIVEGIKDDSVELGELQQILDTTSQKLSTLRSYSDKTVSEVKAMKDFSGYANPNESLRDRLVNGYSENKSESALKSIQDRLNAEFNKIEQLQVKLQALVEKAMDDTDAEMGSQIGDEDVASSRESSIQSITKLLGNPKGLTEILFNLSSQDLMDFQVKALNAMNPEDISALLAEIQAKAGNPPPAQPQPQPL